MTFSKNKSLRIHLIRGATGSFVLKIVQTALTLLAAVVLARVLGVEDFGIYAFCLSIIQILTLLSTLGGEQLLVREVAVYKSKGEYHFLRGLLLRFCQASFFVSIFLALVTAGFGYMFYRNSLMLIPFLVAGAIIPMHTAMQLQGAALRGLGNLLLGQIAFSLRPAFVIVIVGILFWNSGMKQNAEVALSAEFVGGVVIFAITFVLLYKLLPRKVKNVKPNFETAKWGRSAFPFVFASGMWVFNNQCSSLILGILHTPEGVGLFRVAQRGALLILFALQAVNISIAPTVAEMFTKGERRRLQRLISKSILAALAIALPTALVLILGGKWIIPFVFGSSYAPAYYPLTILCIGQLINVGMGSVGLILNMAGLEHYTARGVAIAAFANLAFNVILIPYFGTVGAAIATSTSLVIWNIMLSWYVYKEIGIISTIKFK